MTAPNEQQFLNDLDKKLWTAADPGSSPGLRRHCEALRSGRLDAAVYKQAVLGLN